MRFLRVKMTNSEIRIELITKDDEEEVLELLRTYFFKVSDCENIIGDRFSDEMI